MVKVVYPSILCDDTVRKLSAIGIEKMSDYVNEIETAPDAVKLLFKDKLEMMIVQHIYSVTNVIFGKEYLEDMLCLSFSRQDQPSSFTMD